MTDEEKWFVVEHTDEGDLALPEWFVDKKEALEKAKKYAKGIRTEGHQILCCEVLATHEKPKEKGEGK